MRRKSKVLISSALVVVVVIIAVVSWQAYKAASLPDYGVTTNIHGKLSNLEAQNAFVQAHSEGNSGRWQRIVYTIEGYPIIYTVRYDAKSESLEISIDGRQNEFGKKDVHTYQCQGLIATEEVRLTGCRDVSSGEIVIP